MSNLYRPRMADPLHGAYRERSWRVEVLTRDEQSLGFLGDASASTDAAGVVSWDVTANANSQVGLTGTLRVRGDVGVDWSVNRLRIWETLSGVGTWPLGVFIPALPTPEHNWRDTSWNVGLLGKLHAVARDRLTASWEGTPATPATDLIGLQLAYTDEPNAAITPSPATLPAPILWASGTSRLTLCNELAGAIGYRGLRADPAGRVLSEPYTLPAERDPAMTFSADALTLLSPDWAEDWDLDAPNVVLARSQEQPDGTVWETTAEDWDTGRPSSIPRREGQRVVHVEDAVEVATQAALAAHAARRLSELTTPAQRFTVEHLTVPTVELSEGRPGLWTESVVIHTRPGLEPVRCVVEDIHWRSDSPMCRATWRRV